MSILQDLLKDLVKTGPSNVVKLMELAEKLPSESTLKQLNDTVNRLIPYIPQLEKILGDGNIKNMEILLTKIPDSRTLNRLADSLPMLEKLPDQKTLNELLSKMDSLKGFLDNLEGGN